MKLKGSTVHGGLYGVYACNKTNNGSLHNTGHFCDSIKELRSLIVYLFVLCRMAFLFCSGCVALAIIFGHCLCIMFVCNFKKRIHIVIACGAIVFAFLLYHFFSHGLLLCRPGKSRQCGMLLLPLMTSCIH